MATKPGRPRLDARPGFRDAFCRILPKVLAGEITPRDASIQLGVSVRSFKRYVGLLGTEESGSGRGCR